MKGKPQYKSATAWHSPPQAQPLMLQFQHCSFQLHTVLSAPKLTHLQTPPGQLEMTHEGRAKQSLWIPPEQQRVVSTESCLPDCSVCHLLVLDDAPGLSWSLSHHTASVPAHLGSWGCSGAAPGGGMSSPGLPGASLHIAHALPGLRSAHRFVCLGDFSMKVREVECLREGKSRRLQANQAL